MYICIYTYLLLSLSAEKRSILIIIRVDDHIEQLRFHHFTKCIDIVVDYYNH